MKLILCRLCEGGALWSEKYPCMQCDDMEVYHIADNLIQEDDTVVPCGCPSCSTNDAAAKQ